MQRIKYSPDILSVTAEQTLLQGVRDLPFREFEFHGYVGKRPTVSYGWRYDFKQRTLYEADDIPEFLIALRRVAGFAELRAQELQQVLVTEYDAGAGIGWHKDKAVFGDIVGISLLAPCRFRFRRKDGDKWQRISITAEPRSAYLLRGPSRSEWEHSIPLVTAVRYSITFRNLRPEV